MTPGPVSASIYTAPHFLGIKSDAQRGNANHLRPHSQQVGCRSPGSGCTASRWGCRSPGSVKILATHPQRRALTGDMMAETGSTELGQGEGLWAAGSCTAPGPVCHCLLGGLKSLSAPVHLPPPPGHWTFLGSSPCSPPQVVLTPDSLGLQGEPGPPPPPNPWGALASSTSLSNSLWLPNSPVSLLP